MTKHISLTVIAILAILSLGFAVYLVIEVDSLSLKYHAKTLDRMFLTSIAMTFVYLTMGVFIGTEGRHYTVYPLFISFALLLFAISY